MFHLAGTAPRNLRFGHVVNVLTGGNHHPLLCQLEDANGPAGTWVVKPQHVLSTSADRESFFVMAELAGSEVCAWGGVPTPAVGLVRFPDSIDSAVIRGMVSRLGPAQQEEIVELYKLNRGLLAFCSRHLEGALDVDAGTFNTKARRAELVSVGCAVYYVDAYLRNDDRERENPNLLWMYNRLVAIDHGLAFAGLARRGAAGRRLAQQTVIHAPRAFRRHTLHRPLKKCRHFPGFSDPANRLGEVPDADIARLATLWPAELNETTLHGRSGLLDELIGFLDERRAYASEIATNLYRFFEGNT